MGVNFIWLFITFIQVQFFYFIVFKESEFQYNTFVDTSCRFYCNFEF